MKSTGDLYAMRLLVSDKPGVLVRVLLVFSRRGINIETLKVSRSDSTGFSDIYITLYYSGATLPGIGLQLEKLVDVVMVEVFPVAE